MPITKSAKKALRNSGKKRVFNLRKKDLINKSIKNLKASILKKDSKAIGEQMKATEVENKEDYILYIQSVIDYKDEVIERQMNQIKKLLEMLVDRENTPK